MKETIAQFLKVQKFPFTIKDENGNEIYYEDSNGYWEKREYDLNGKEIYWEDSTEAWVKREFDLNGKEIYFENSNGIVRDNRPKPVVEMTLQEIADKLGMDVKSIRIKE
jgi:hypothetical protein